MRVDGYRPIYECVVCFAMPATAVSDFFTYAKWAPVDVDVTGIRSILYLSPVKLGAQCSSHPYAPRPLRAQALRRILQAASYNNLLVFISADLLHLLFYVHITNTHVHH